MSIQFSTIPTAISRISRDQSSLSTLSNIEIQPSSLPDNKNADFPPKVPHEMVLMRQTPRKITDSSGNDLSDADKYVTNNAPADCDDSVEREKELEKSLNGYKLKEGRYPDPSNKAAIDSEIEKLRITIRVGDGMEFRAALRRLKEWGVDSRDIIKHDNDKCLDLLDAIKEASKKGSAYKRNCDDYTHVHEADIREKNMVWGYRWGFNKKG